MRVERLRVISEHFGISFVLDRPPFVRDRYSFDRDIHLFIPVLLQVFCFTKG